jgi:hypothetical protein
MHPIHPIGPRTHVVGRFEHFLTAQTLVQGRTGAVIAQVRAMNSSRNFSQLTHPIHLIRPQTHVSARFGTFRYCTNFGAKWTELEHLMHKFVQRSCAGILRNERTRATPLDAKLMFWSVSEHFVTAKLRCKTGPTSAINGQVSATKSLRNFSQQTHPTHHIGPQTHVLYRFGPFRYCTNFGIKWDK